MANRTIILECDDDDFDAIQQEITRGQLQDAAGFPAYGETDSNISGALVGEMVRNLREYRDIYESQLIVKSDFDALMLFVRKLVGLLYQAQFMGTRELKGIRSECDEPDNVSELEIRLLAGLSQEGESDE